MSLDREECRSIHRLHQRTKASYFRKSINKYFQRHWSNAVTEIEQAFLDAKPITQVHGIRTSSRHADEANSVFGLSSNVVHTGDDNLQDWPSVTTKQMNFVND